MAARTHSSSILQYHRRPAFVDPTFTFDDTSFDEPLKMELPSPQRLASGPTFSPPSPRRRASLDEGSHTKARNGSIKLQVGLVGRVGLVGERKGRVQHFKCVW